MSDAEFARGHLDRHPLFRDLSPDTRGQLAAIARRRRWPSGATLFQRGDPGREMILVASGRIRLSVLSAEGRELSLRQAEAGSLIGEIAVLDGGERSADGTAVGDVEALVFSRADLERAMARAPDLSLAFIQLLCRRLRETTDQLESIALYRLEARLARFFLGIVRQRTEGRETAPSVRMRMPFNQSEIADIVGASRPKVNRALQVLEEAGAITRTDEMVVCRLAQLEEIAGADGGE